MFLIVFYQYLIHFMGVLKTLIFFIIWYQYIWYTSIELWGIFIFCIVLKHLSFCLALMMISRALRVCSSSANILSSNLFLRNSIRLFSALICALSTVLWIVYIARWLIFCCCLDEVYCLEWYICIINVSLLSLICNSPVHPNKEMFVNVRIPCCLSGAYTLLISW